MKVTETVEVENFVCDKCGDKDLICKGFVDKGKDIHLCYPCNSEYEKWFKQQPEFTQTVARFCGRALPAEKVVCIVCGETHHTGWANHPLTEKDFEPRDLL
jgi:hypothetical protein